MRRAILCALIILSGGAAVAGEAAGGPPAEPSADVRTPAQACLPDAPHPKFLQALLALADRADEQSCKVFSQQAIIGGASTCLDDPKPGDAARTAAVLIDSYAAERASLCRGLASADVELAAARQRAAEWKSLYESEMDTSALYREKWNSALRKAAAPSAGGRRLIGCGPGGGLVYEPDGVISARPFAGCILVVWP